MKPIFLVALILVALAVAGCSVETPVKVDTTVAATSDTPNTTAPETTATTEPAAEVYMFGDTLALWDMEMTVGAPELADGGLFATEGKDFYACLVEITNTGDESRPYNTMYFSCQDTEHFSYNSAIMAGELQDLGSGDLQPGKKVKGYVGFEVPTGETIASVTFEPMIIGLKASATWEQ